MKILFVGAYVPYHWIAAGVSGHFTSCGNCPPNTTYTCSQWNMGTLSEVVADRCTSCAAPCGLCPRHGVSPVPDSVSCERYAIPKMW